MLVLATISDGLWGRRSSLTQEVMPEAVGRAVRQHKAVCILGELALPAAIGRIGVPEGARLTPVLPPVGEDLVDVARQLLVLKNNA